jgi:hypothetical protein
MSKALIDSVHEAPIAKQQIIKTILCRIKNPQTALMAEKKESGKNKIVSTMVMAMMVSQ